MRAINLEDVFYIMELNIPQRPEAETLRGERGLQIQNSENISEINPLLWYKLTPPFLAGFWLFHFIPKNTFHFPYNNRSPIAHPVHLFLQSKVHVRFHPSRY